LVNRIAKSHLPVAESALDTPVLSLKLKKRKLVAVLNGTDKVWVAVTGGTTGVTSSFLQLVNKKIDTTASAEKEEIVFILIALFFYKSFGKIELK
jgi:NADPH:quinone reductase-like Zn-dependent oxidoreductase